MILKPGDRLDRRRSWGSRRRYTRPCLESWRPVLFQPARRGNLGRKPCRHWLHVEHRQLARMVAHRHDVGAGDCRPFPVLRLRLKPGA